jgi:LPXTG-motif cell wall-anchored protein
VSATVGNTAPGGVATNPGWNGTSDTTVASGVNLAAGGVHTYGVTVNFSVPAGSGGSSNDCTLEPGESGTGLLNTATVNNNGTTNQDTACAQVVPPTPPPPPPPPATVPPSPEDPGQLPATGGNSAPIAQIAMLLVAFGALVVFATRRNLRRRRRPA